MAETSDNKVLASLQTDGPQPIDELPYKLNSQEKWRHGIQTFRPKAPRQPGSSGGPSRSVLYVEDDHSPAEVVEAWLEANPQVVEALSSYAIHRRVCEYGEEFKAASMDILGPFDMSGE